MESFKPKKSIKLKILDWWDDTCKSADGFYNLGLVQMLQKYYDVVYSDEPDFVIYGPFGYEHMKYDCVKIFYCLENLRTDYNVADYGMALDYVVLEDRSMHLNCGVWIYDSTHPRIVGGGGITLEEIKQKNKFCSIMVSDIGRQEWNPRELFFNKLSQYKKVDSGGAWNNNIGTPIGLRCSNRTETKIQWLKSYKFNICFENSSYPGYLTEKIFDALEAGCIPIYWGDTSLRCNLGLNGGGFGEIDNRIPSINEEILDIRINPKRYINVHSFSTFDEVIEEIIRIDNDEKAFYEMVQAPIFLDDFDLEACHRKIEIFFRHIFNQDTKDAKRIPKGMRAHTKSEHMKLLKHIPWLLKFERLLCKTKRFSKWRLK